DDAPAQRRRLRSADGRQYRHADPVAAAARARACARHRMLLVPDRSCPDARSARRHPAQCQRGSPRPTRHVARVRRNQGAPGGGRGALRGLHNAQNAAGAAGAALALGLAPDAIQKGLVSFPGLAHRMEQVGRKGPVLFVNDSKATNADAAARALASFADIFWIAGGKAKTGGITSLNGYFPRIRKAYLIGEAAGEFAGTLQGKVPFLVAGTLDRAVELAT